MSPLFRKNILVLILGLATFIARAQGDMRFFGTATFNGSPLSGANVSVLMDGKQIINLTTGKNGKFKFTIDLGHTYTINYSALGCVPMYMTMDLNVPADKAWIYPDYVAEIPFFTSADPKVNTQLFSQKPFIKVVFDGSKGFHDDPTYRFIDEIFKDPNDELLKQQEAARKLAEDKARLQAEEQARIDEAERLRLQQEADDRARAAEDARNKANDQSATTTSTTDDAQPVVTTDAIQLEKEKQDRLTREKQNKNIRAEYENNLLKLVAESERATNIKKYNKLKEDAEGNTVVTILRREAEVKALSAFLIEQQKERARQTLANKQVKESAIKDLITTAALVERDIRASQLKPVIAYTNMSYAPSPNIVETTDDGFFRDVKSTVISWPGGIRTIFRMEQYWWGSCYYYHDNVEIDIKTYEAELFKHKRS
ncbi:MAG TPA: hypothetical protein VL651_01750 [Bacteroidia bacterium]|nr:hypothetical protein [Bacteroidia bacterium]